MQALSAIKHEYFLPTYNVVVLMKLYLDSGHVFLSVISSCMFKLGIILVTGAI